MLSPSCSDPVLVSVLAQSDRTVKCTESSEAAQWIERWLWVPRSRVQILCAAETWALSLFFVLVLHVASSPYLAFALAGCFVCHLYVRRDLGESLTAALAGLSYAIAYFLFPHPERAYIGFSVGAAGAFLGCGSLGVMVLKLQSATSETRTALKATIVTAALAPVLCSVSLCAVSQAASLTPLTFDSELYRFDRGLGVDTFHFARAWSNFPHLYSAAAFVYNAMPLYVTACLALIQRRTKPRGFPWAVVALGAVGFLFYQICPAAGPVYRFPCFPGCLPALAEGMGHPTPLHAPAMNAMPSLHVGWTLLCLLYVSRSGWGPRLVAVVVLALTVCATLVSGEHYLVDLVVAVPLAVAIRGAFFLETGRRARVVVGGGGLAVVLAWTVSGRLGLLANCSLPWSWTVVTVTVSLSLAGLAWISRQASKPAPAVGR